MLSSMLWETCPIWGYQGKEVRGWSRDHRIHTLHLQTLEPCSFLQMKGNGWPNQCPEETWDNRGNDQRRDLHVLVVGSVFSDQIDEWRRSISNEIIPVARVLMPRYFSGPAEHPFCVWPCYVETTWKVVGQPVTSATSRAYISYHNIVIR